MKNAASCLFVCFFAACLSLSASELLPNPFELPSTPSDQTDGSCKSCSNPSGTSQERPFLSMAGKAALDINLAAEFSPVKHKILQLRIGTPQPFMPTEAYLLIPPSSSEKASKEYLIAYLGDERKILFKAKTSEEIGSTSFVSENYPEMSVKRSDKDLVLYDCKDNMEYVFSSQDGMSWRISSIANRDLKSNGIVCEYDKEGRISAIVHSDKSRYMIDYKNGFASKITSPAGAVTELSWDEKSFLKEVKTTIPSDHPFYPENMKTFAKSKQAPFVVRDLHLECEKEGGIASLINTEGEKFSAEYRADADKKANTKYVLSILTYPDNRRIYLRVSWAADSSKIIENGFVLKDAKNSEVFEFEKRSYMSKIGPSYVVTATETVEGKTENIHDKTRPVLLGKKDVLGRTTNYMRDDKGRRSAIVYPDGSSESYKYDENDHLVEKTDEIGAVTSYKYIDNKLASVDDKGIATVYLYSASGRPSETKMADGTAHKFTFDELGRIVAHIKPDGTKTVYSYFKGLNAISSMESVSSDEKASYSRTFGYEPAGRLAKITYPDKMFEAFKYSCCALTETIDRSGAVTKFIYDAGHRKVAEITHNGEKTQYEYDIRNNVTKVTSPDKTFASYKYDSAKNKIEEVKSDGTWIKYEYDKGGRKIGLSQSDGRTAKFVHDLRDRVVSVTGTAIDNMEYKYDLAGNTLLATNYGLPRAEKGRETAYKYDENGRLAETINPDGSTEKNFFQGASNRLMATIGKGIVTRYGFDNAGRINVIARYSADALKQCRTAEERNALFEKNITEKRSYNTFGNLFEVQGKDENKDAFRLLVRCDYSPDDQLKSILKPTSDTGAEKFTYSYQFKGDGLKEVSIYRRFIEHPDLSRLSYDEKLAYACVVSKDKLVKTDDTNGTLLSKTLEKAGKRVYSIDALGEKRFFEYDKAGRIAEVLDEKKEQQAAFSYDKNGRQDAVVEPLGRVYKSIYDKEGKLAAVENPIGEKSVLGYNEFGRLVGRSGAGGYDLSYTYTAFGEIASYIDGNGSKTCFKYDDFGRLASRVWPDGSTIKYEYNDNGLISKKTESDRTTVYTYDNLNMLVKVEIVQGNEKSSTELGYNSVSMLVKISDENGSVVFEYDSFGRLVFEKGSIGEIKYSYNSTGLLSAKTCILEGKDFKTEYFYDELNRLVKVSSSAGEYVYSYDQKGKIASLAFGNIKVTNEYDKIGRLTLKKINDKVLCNYEYDKLDRCVKSIVNDITWLYRYDPKGQLLSASSSNGKSYGYVFDPIGNRLSDVQFKYVYNNLNQIIKSELINQKGAVETLVVHDKYGNIIKSLDMECKYDLHNRITEVRKNNLLIKYFYDPLNQRIKSEELNINDIKTTNFLMSGMVEQARIVDGVVQFHTLGLDINAFLSSTGGISAVLASTTDNITQNYFYDRNGNVIVVTDSKDKIINQINYSPFGEIIGERPLIPFTFSTKTSDSSGLFYYGFRFYNPCSGRWLSRDPAEEDGSWNIYAFVNNSLNYIDYLGLDNIEIKYGVYFTIDAPYHQLETELSNRSDKHLGNITYGLTYTFAPIVEKDVKCQAIEDLTCPTKCRTDCNLSVNVEFKIRNNTVTINLPAWSKYAEAPKDQQKAWDDFVTLVKNHEFHHLDIIKQAYIGKKDIKGTGSDCIPLKARNAAVKDFNNKLKNEVKEREKESNKLHDAWDASPEGKIPINFPQL